MRIYGRVCLILLNYLYILFFKTFRNYSHDCVENTYPIATDLLNYDVTWVRTVDLKVRNNLLCINEVNDDHISARVLPSRNHSGIS